jgi:hypothetical protein
MDLRVTIKRIEDRTRLRSQAETRVASSLRRFRDRIGRVAVFLEDVTGPHKQVVDKRCRISVRLRRGGALLIEDVRADAFDALAVALDRLKAALSRKAGEMKRGVGSG